MDPENSSKYNNLRHTDAVGIRRITADDLGQISKFAYTVSITDPLIEFETIHDAFRVSGFWKVDAGAVAIVEMTTGRSVGTSQFYRSAPCIHGYELGYIIHEPQIVGTALRLKLCGCFRTISLPRFRPPIANSW